VSADLTTPQGQEAVNGILAVVVVALLLRAKEAAALSAISEAGWWRLNASARCPAPVRVGGATRWRRSDIEEWVKLGCPSRREFEAVRAANGGRAAR
jgi:predicted DNA-binding transcriptional regulator AlpA